MLIDLNELDGSRERARRIDADLCIVGAGPAGITLAMELARPSRRIVVLESGGAQPDPRTQALCEGSFESDLKHPVRDYLSNSRVRALGGSTHRWWAFCRPLDPIDFEERAWVPDSGWPFGGEELDPYYRRAAEVCGVRAFDYDEREILPGLGLGKEFSQLDYLEPTLFHLGWPPKRFGEAYREQLDRAPGLQVFLHATVTDIRLESSHRRVEALEVSSLGGKRLEVRAARYVLAAGGIENARLLLHSDRQIEAGIGNGRDLVGRYFMEHPHLLVGHVAFVGPRPAAGPFIEAQEHPAVGERVLGVLRSTRKLQTEQETLNVTLQLAQPAPPAGSPLSSAVFELADRMRRLRDADSEEGPAATFALFARTEQAPNYESRLELAPERDELGMRRAKLLWKLGDLDRRSWIQTVEALAKDLGARLRGRVQLTLPRDRWSAGAGGDHHMGTTRMHPDPERGVVDSSCRVHDVENLWIAGSSVFPTSGASNPTLTLVALTLRLADELDRVWGST